jgi:hypothetical protein
MYYALKKIKLIFFKHEARKANELLGTNNNKYSLFLGVISWNIIHFGLI